MLFKTVGNLVLASASPRRQEMLKNIGINFDIIHAEVDEQIQSGDSPAEYVRRIAAAKSLAVSSQYPGAWVLGADTAVVVEDEILGKPADIDHARRMLMDLSGRYHEVWTGFCMSRHGESVLSRTVKTEVTFIELSEKICDAYLATGEFHDKAGSYGIQGQGGFLVEKISGSYTNVVGLPLAEVVQEMLRLGIVHPCSDTA